MGFSKKIGIAVIIVALAVGIGLASPLFYEKNINEPLPTKGYTSESDTDETLSKESDITSSSEIDLDESLSREGIVVDSSKVTEENPINLTAPVTSNTYDDLLKDLASISIAEMNDQTTLENTIIEFAQKGVLISDIEDTMFESFKELDENDEVRKMLEEDQNELLIKLLMNAAANTTTDAIDDMDMPMDPNVLKSGNFVGIDGHQASGLAKIIQIEGDNYLRFENFDVTNGPDLRVYMTLDGNVNDGIHLEKLKGSSGAQNYMLGDIDIEQYNTVVIYCQPFSAYFGSAILF
ncbi:MAG: electron transporter [Cenarchaeum symbiont of Oopsacas minuta]|nr:electron transporter [Cenarchaeum symbiont of Oopsacas minuta]